MTDETPLDLAEPDFCAILRSKIAASDEPQGEIARRAKMSDAALSRFATGKNGLTIENFQNLCAVFGLSLATPPALAENDSTPPTDNPSPNAAEPRKSSDTPPTDTPPSWARPFEPGEAIRYVNVIKQWMPKRPVPTRGIVFPEFYKNQSGQIFEGRCLNSAYFAREGQKIVSATWNKIDFFPIRACDLPPNLPLECAIFEEKTHENS